MPAPLLEERMRKLVRASLFEMAVGDSILFTFCLITPSFLSIALNADLFRITSVDTYSAIAFADISFFGAASVQIDLVFEGETGYHTALTSELISSQNNLPGATQRVLPIFGRRKVEPCGP
jgi:hypothetical protein